MSKKWEELTTKEKQTGCAVIGAVLLVLIGIICAEDSDEVAKLNKQKEEKAKPVLTEAEKREIERKEKIQSQFHFWDGRHINLAEKIKESLHSPDSFKHVKTTYRDAGDHLIVSTWYKASNLYGVILEGYVMAKINLEGEIMEILMEE